MGLVIHKMCAKKDAKLEKNTILIYRSINGDGSKDLEKIIHTMQEKLCTFFKGNIFVSFGIGLNK